ncbi:LptA/OstA family protein [Roseovarius sp. C7]|uniref:LptA/OstA family protein n=1 Tax=Roseovarius sp. C7 TaxID=3398643 RepID=UPI0039F7219B
MTAVIRTVLTVAALGLSASWLSAQAQGTQVAFGAAPHERDLPVEVTAENLSVDQQDGTAIFTGDVLIAQGEMRLSAPWVKVHYLEGESKIEKLEAKEGVTLVSGEDAAELRQADYNVSTGIITMDGDVLLVQGRSAITGDRMFVDTAAGTARVNGRVKTVLQPESSGQ